MKKNKIPNITARDFATILDLNPYQSAYELLEEKVEKKHPFFGNKFTEHGIRYENQALQSYKQYTGVNTINEQVDMSHIDYKWITGRLDGVIEEYINDGKGKNNKKRKKQLCVLEVKCPLKEDRENELTEDNIPIQYWCQCQVYMNLINCNYAYYIEYYIKPNDKPENAKLYIIKIKRNIIWWETSLPKIKLFYEEMKYYCEKGNLETHPVRKSENVWKQQYKLII